MPYGLEMLNTGHQLLAVTFHELWERQTAEGVKIKLTTAVISVAEAIGLNYQTTLSAHFYGENPSMSAL